MERFLWICLGGAVGTGGRYLVSGWVHRVLGPTFPYGTLAVNLLGSFLIGVIMSLALSSEQTSPTVRLALTTGVLGGFTTYSTFSYETTLYFQEGAWAVGLLNIVVTTVGAVLACVLGFACIRWF